MMLTPREEEKLMVYVAADLARKRKARGLKLNVPESVALITEAMLEGARDGKTVAEVMDLGCQVLTREDVMEGVAELVSLVQVEGVHYAFLTGPILSATDRIRWKPLTNSRPSGS